MSAILLTDAVIELPDVDVDMFGTFGAILSKKFVTVFDALFAFPAASVHFHAATCKLICAAPYASVQFICATAV